MGFSSNLNFEYKTPICGCVFTLRRIFISTMFIDLEVSRCFSRQPKLSYRI